MKRRAKPKDTGEFYDFTFDYLMALRYVYYCQSISVLSDKEYDDLESAYKTSNRAGFERLRVGSDSASSYPPHIRALGLYLSLRKNNKQDTPTQNTEHGTKKKKSVLRKRKIKIK